jgi:DNA-binding MarR family transcriptional regulator
MLIVALKRLLHGIPMTPAAPSAESLENPLESLVGYRLRQVSLAIAADLSERLEALSLTLISLSVLLTIEANPGVTQSDLCRRLGIKRANMTPQVFQFERRKLIERLAADGRSQSLRLTAKGKALSASARNLVQANESAFLSALSADEQTALESALARLDLWRLSPLKTAT